MTNMDNENISKLDRCLRTNPILFTGAGFSLGATNALGHDLPSGWELKKIILTKLLGYKEGDDDYNECLQYTLSDLCTYAKTEKSQNVVNDFIVEQFIGCEPKPFHKKLAGSRLWKKVYTINIDDLFENSAPKSRLAVQNMPRQISYTGAKQIEYIKLHGCVNNRAEGVVFSRSEYIDSMLQSQDYRFSSFARDMQTQNFVIVGTEMDEINLDYYLKLFGINSNNSSRGQLFFINPKPSRLFKAKVSIVGATIIEWTTEEFADHISKIEPESNSKESLRLDGYICLNELYNNDKYFKGYRSNLYFGEYPKFKDVVFDWDFIHPEINCIFENINSRFHNSSNSLSTLYGKTMVGKSVYLYRLAMQLIHENCCVYKFVGDRFDYYHFAFFCRTLPFDKVVLIFDNAGFYYSSLRELLKVFPKDKNIAIIATTRTYSHFRKRYSLVASPEFMEFLVSGATKERSGLFAKEIESKLDNKGYLGLLKSRNKDERIGFIKSHNDVSSLLYSITEGSNFRKRSLDSYKTRRLSSFGHDFLTVLAFLQKLELPYLPLELLALWNVSNYSNVLKECEDFITIHEDFKGVTLRSNILTNNILNGLPRNYKIKLLKEILILLAPQMTGTIHSYWTEMISSLMKVKLLRGFLKMNTADVKNLLSDIKTYYNEDFNYWLQVGIAEQYDSDYEAALNHFHQAESLSPTSYIVRNAIARNYLRQANEINPVDDALLLFQQGEELMVRLIQESEEFQVKAFSTHCLLFEKVRFFNRHNLVPDKATVDEMMDKLKYVIDRDPKSPMTRHISNVFGQFLVKHNLTKKLGVISMYDLKYIKGILSDDPIDENFVLEDFEIDS